MNVRSSLERRTDVEAVEFCWRRASRRVARKLSKVEMATLDTTDAGRASRIGFVFDLDGVIYHSGANGKALVPGTVAALSLLEKHRVPYAFVSNGTGYSELEKATLIGQLLDGAIRVPREKVFLCATPMRDLAKEYAGRRVLIVGGDIVHGEPDTARRLAFDLGFRDFVTMADFAARRPHLLSLIHI